MNCYFAVTIGKRDEIVSWCKETLHGDWYDFGGPTSALFYVSEVNDVVMFKLRNWADVLEEISY